MDESPEEVTVSVETWLSDAAALDEVASVLLAEEAGVLSDALALLLTESDDDVPEEAEELPDEGPEELPLVLSAPDAPA